MRKQHKKKAFQGWEAASNEQKGETASLHFVQEERADTHTVIDRPTTKVISIYTHKGGVGKTTTAENLAHILASAGRKVALVDTDREAHASNLLQTEMIPTEKWHTLTHVVCQGIPLRQAMYQARENLWVIPADSNMNDASEYILKRQAQGIMRDRFHALLEDLAPPPEALLPWQQQPSIRIWDFKVAQPVLPSQTLEHPDYLDYLIVDHAPNPGALGDSILRITQEIWSPLKLEPLPVQGFAAMVPMLKALFKDHPEQEPSLHIIPYMVSHNRNSTTSLFAQLLMSFPGQVARTVHDCGDIPDGQGEQPPKTVFEYKRSSKGAKELLELALQVEGYHGDLKNGPTCMICDQIKAFADEQVVAARKA